MMEEKNKPEGDGNIRPLKVLIVDDEPISLKMVSHKLKQLGIVNPENVRKANSGQEAINIFQEYKESNKGFDLIITDFNMESAGVGFDGDVLIQKLREAGYEGKIIGMSGDDPKKLVSGENARTAMLTAGANAFVVKDEIISEIGRIIKSLFSDGRHIAGEVKPSGDHSAEEQQREAIVAAAGLGVKITSPMSRKLPGDNAKTPIGTFQEPFSRDRAETEVFYPPHEDLTGLTSSISKTPSDSVLSDGSPRTQESIAEARRTARELVGDAHLSALQRLQADRRSHRKHLPPLSGEHSLEQSSVGPLVKRIVQERISGAEDLLRR